MLTTNRKEGIIIKTNHGKKHGIKYPEKANEYEINGNIAYLKLFKKDGTTINATIDATDLKIVLEKGTWFAQWHKDFNKYLVQTTSEKFSSDKKHTEKITLQSFLLNVHTKAPIRHLNGDTLDNRRSNLELYDQNTVNDYYEHNEKNIAIILTDRYGNENAKTIIDKDDLDRVVNTGYRWVCHKINSEPYAVANTPEGRIFLNRFIMNTPQNMVTHAINLNTLDNRKANLEHITLHEEEPDIKNSKKF